MQPTSYEAFSLDAAWAMLAPFIPVVQVWVIGLAVGLLLPRPKWPSKSATILMSAPGFSSFRKIALVCHILVILREFWKHFTHPGTFRGLVRATVQWACGNGWTFTWPAHAVVSELKAFQLPAEEASSDRIDNWYVGEKDLAWFKYHAIENGATAGASAWEKTMDKDMPGFVRYTSYRRTLPDGKTEYKSVTISPNATAREFSDLYLDDDFRRNWDGMVYHHEVLEHGDFSQRQQVVRWLRRFPFAFLSDRDYCIARREFKEDDGSIYGISKAVPDHPRAFPGGQHVTMEVYHSMWRSRTVPDPWGADTPACETVLLHHEQFKISEGLARFAVKHGMWGFVKKLASTVPLYVEARRKRVGPNEEDPEAYGAGAIPNPPAINLKHSDSVFSLQSMSSTNSSYDGSECSDDSAQRSGGHMHSNRRRRRAVLVASLAVGALALTGVCGANTTGKQSNSQRGSKAGRRHHVRMGKAVVAEEAPVQTVVSHRLEEVPELIEDC